MSEFTVAAPDGNPGFMKTTCRLAWQALLLQEKAYTPMQDDSRPFRRGFGTILLILFTVAVAYTVGVVLNLLTLPRVDLVQQGVYDIIVNTAWFEQQTAGFRQMFNTVYVVVWQIIRFVGGYPSWLGAIYAFVTVVVLGVLNWLGYGIIAHMVGRWLGGSVDKGKFFGALALSYAPALLLVVNIFPGLSVPAGLISLWTMATNYQAIKATFKLSWVRTVLVLLLPYLIAVIGFYIAIHGGIALGVAVYKMIS